MKFIEYNFTINYLAWSISPENQVLLHKEKTADFETRQAQIFIIPYKGNLLKIGTWKVSKLLIELSPKFLQI